MHITFRDCSQQEGTSYVRARLALSIKHGYLDGCYVNGVYIATSNEKEEIKKTKLQEYRAMQERTYSIIEKDISSQIVSGRMRGKK